MNYLDQYTIPFKGLKEGEHEFEFALDERFFMAFEKSEIKKANLIARVMLEKKTTFLTLHFSLSGTAEIQCDRCLEYFDLPVSHNATLFVKFVHGKQSEQEDVVFLPPEEHQIIISQMLYDFAHLSLPYKRIHPENNKGKSLCNKEMLAKLAKFSAGVTHPHQRNSTSDPRWNELKKLLNNNR